MKLMLYKYFSASTTYYSNKCFSTVAGTLFRKGIFFERYRNYQCSRKYSFIPKAEIEMNNSLKTVKNFIPFEDMLEKKRSEAKRSILVQVHSELSCFQLFEYSQQFGDIMKMIHYSLQPNLHFVIVEFDNEISTYNIIKNSVHAENVQIVPVRSPFLWFKANDIGKKKKKVISNEINDNALISKFGNVECPNHDELSSWLLTGKNISDQMLILFEAMVLDDLGTRMRFITAAQIESTLSGMFPLVRALPFGSTVNSFGQIGCDLDVVLRLDLQPEECLKDNRLVFQTKTSLVNSRTQQQRYIESVADLIERYLPGCTSVRRILQARVPILKFKQEYSGIECDLSLTNTTGVYMSELLNIYGTLDERVRPLVYTIRYWAKQINLTNQSPGRWITNFSLTLLTLFYLQQVKIIPSLDNLIKLARPQDKRFADDVNCTFLRDITTLLNNISENKSSLSKLLLGFFEFYSLFDFDTKSISLKSGKALPKQEYAALYIVNPLETHLNVSKNVSPEELGRIKIEICNAARYLEREIKSQDTKIGANEGWGLITLFESSHYNSKTRDAFYTAVQRKQTLDNASAHRLVSVTELFDDENNNKPQSELPPQKKIVKQRTGKTKTSIT